jgi:hypothetical protein
LAALLDYARYTEAIGQTQFALNARTSGKVRWLEDGSVVGEAQAPDVEIRELLHVMRPILLKDEATNFSRVANIVARRLDHPVIRQHIDDWKAAFGQKASQAVYQLTSGDLLLNSDEALDLWLNAFEYHRDKDKQQKLGKQLGEMPVEAAKPLFVAGLIDKAHAALSLARLVRAIERTPDGSTRR